MIGSLYTLTDSSQDYSTAITMLELVAPANGVALLERIWIKQTSFDTSENIGTTTQRITTTGTGAATVLEPLMVAQAAYSGTGKVLFTIEPTYTADTMILEDGFNVLSGYLWTPANDDEIIVVEPGGLIGTNLDVAPSTGMNFSYGYTVREIGG